jgi:hypothetical protein
MTLQVDRRPKKPLPANKVFLILACLLLVLGLTPFVWDWHRSLADDVDPNSMTDYVEELRHQKRLIVESPSKSSDNQTPLETELDSLELSAAEPSRVAAEEKPNQIASKGVVTEADPNPFLKLLAAPELWPSEVKLMRDTDFPAVINGKPVGTVRMKAGARAELVDLNTEVVELRFRDGTVKVPHEATNLPQLVPSPPTQVNSEVAEPNNVKDSALDQKSSAARSGMPNSALRSEPLDKNNQGAERVKIGAPYIREEVPPEIAEADPRAEWTVPVVVIRFIPKSKDGTFLDRTKAPSFRSLKPVLFNKIRERLDGDLIKTRFYRQEGTRFRAYKNPEAPPSITYQVFAIYTVEDLPPSSAKFFTRNSRDEQIPYPDWFDILKAIDAESWVEKMGVKEFWVWSTEVAGTEPSYDPALIPVESFRALAESNMSSKSGDISNSKRLKDLPVYSTTYTVYQYNLDRSVNENIHNHIHQIEHLLNHVEGRNRTPHDKWGDLLFWGKFVGSDASHNLTDPRRCGWCHFPPNADKGYDYSSDKVVLSDIEDWTPDGSGEFKPISSERWNKIEAEWHLLWMQSLPGKDNNLQYKGRALENWWRFVADWDSAVRQKAKLTK